MRTYSFSYRHNGKDWSLNYFADNEEDAKRKLQSMKSNADFDGEVVVSTSIPFISKLFVILKKASFTCNSFCGEQECKENKDGCKRIKKAREG